jgi:hypothetical protein
MSLVEAFANAVVRVAPLTQLLMLPLFGLSKTLRRT